MMKKNETVVTDEAPEVKEEKKPVAKDVHFDFLISLPNVRFDEYMQRVRTRREELERAKWRKR